MLNLNKSLGAWQIVSAKTIMVESWKMVKETGCKIGEALKIKWAELKQFINNLATTYKEHKATLSIKQNNKINKYEIKGENMEDLMENILEKIAEIKDKNFYSNFMKWFCKRWDSAIHLLEIKKKFTFSENQIWAVIQG